MKVANKNIDVVKFAPVGITALLIGWTASVYRHSTYGDAWAIVPALLTLPGILTAHIWLILRRKPRGPYVAYGAIHLTFFATIWIGCLMLISKDSL